MLNLSLIRRFWKVFATTWHWKNICDHYLSSYFSSWETLKHWLKSDLNCTIIMLLMCDPVSEINCNIFGQVWFLKNLFFSNVYISVNMILECCYLFFGLEIGHLLSTYIASRMKGRPSKMCTGAYRGRGVEKSAIRYVRTKWIAPK